MIGLVFIDMDGILALSGNYSRVPGVRDAVVVPEEGVAYLKVDSRAWDRQDCRPLPRPEGRGVPICAIPIRYVLPAAAGGVRN